MCIEVQVYVHLQGPLIFGFGRERKLGMVSIGNRNSPCPGGMEPNSRLDPHTNPIVWGSEPLSTYVRQVVSGTYRPVRPGGSVASYYLILASPANYLE
jgi:hypothetical protein